MKVFVIDGLIGAGKTTLITQLCMHFTAQGFKCVPVYEPLEAWRASGMLGLFYQDPAANAYAFQTYVYTTRIQAILDAFEQEPHADIYLLERSPETDRLFMETLRGAVPPALFSAYESWCDLHDKLLPFDLKKVPHVYLRPDLHMCMERLHSRGRSEEASVTHAYQLMLQQAHDRWYGYGHASAAFGHLREMTAPRLILETNADFREESTAAEIADMLSQK